MSAFGTGSTSYGQFWYGNSTNFPGFLFKKNGGGGRRSTKMGAGGNITCYRPVYIYNKFKPGGGGVGASSISNRRAKNRLATVCNGQSCFPCYNRLGLCNNYTGNPKGFVPCTYISNDGTSSEQSGLHRSKGNLIDGYIKDAIGVLYDINNSSKILDIF